MLGHEGNEETDSLTKLASTSNPKGQNLTLASLRDFWAEKFKVDKQRERSLLGLPDPISVPSFRFQIERFQPTSDFSLLSKSPSRHFEGFNGIIQLFTVSTT